jgi:hypothetical protein
MSCDKCGKECESVVKCGKCKFIKYCSEECRSRDRPFHKEECFDRLEFQKIAKKLMKKLLIRHVNGNTYDCRIENLKKVSALEAFTNPDWTVDVICNTTDEEFSTWKKAQKLTNGNPAMFNFLKCLKKK